jgi:hypothetical protein
MSERTRLHYPTVYVVHTEDKNRYKSVPDYTVYVGETKVAAARDHVENGMARRRSWPCTGSRASHPWNAGAASTGPEVRRRSGRGPRAGPEARNPNRSPNPRASRSSPNRSPI